jgi:hypothetical protein
VVVLNTYITVRNLTRLLFQGVHQDSSHQIFFAPWVRLLAQLQLRSTLSQTKHLNQLKSNRGESNHKIGQIQAACENVKLFRATDYQVSMKAAPILTKNFRWHLHC